MALPAASLVSVARQGIRDREQARETQPTCSRKSYGRSKEKLNWCFSLASPTLALTPHPGSARLSPLKIHFFFCLIFIPETAGLLSVPHRRPPSKSSETLNGTEHPWLLLGHSSSRKIDKAAFSNYLPHWSCNVCPQDDFHTQSAQLCLERQTFSTLTVLFLCSVGSSCPWWARRQGDLSQHWPDVLGKAMVWKCPLNHAPLPCPLTFPWGGGSEDYRNDLPSHSLEGAGNLNPLQSLEQEPMSRGVLSRTKNVGWNVVSAKIRA